MLLFIIFLFVLVASPPTAIVFLLIYGAYKLFTSDNNNKK